MSARATEFDPTPLLRLAATLGGACAADVAAAGAILLQPPPPGSQGPSRSTLNNDGTPLQVCVTCHSRGRVVRLLGDPGASASSFRQRLAAAHAARETLFGSTTIGAIGSRMVTMVVPPDVESHAGAASGILWLATTIAGNGRALYVKARWADPHRDWKQLSTLLGQIMPHPPEIERTIDALRTTARPVSVGLETAGPEQTRVKLYWRLERAVLLRSLGIAMIGDEAIADFLSRVVGPDRLPPSGLIFSHSHDLATGTASDAKVDVCAHCVQRSPQQWQQILEPLAADYGLATPGIGSALEGGRAEIAFVGFGVDRRGEKRLNVYLKDPCRSSILSGSMTP